MLKKQILKGCAGSLLLFSCVGTIPVVTCCEEVAANTTNVDIITSSAAITAYASDTPYSVTGGNIYYTIKKGQASVTDCDENVSNAVIPSSLGGCPVTKISDYAFRNFILPGSLTSIPNSCFRNCTKLSIAVIEDGVQSIDGRAFADCSALSKVYIPDSMQSIDSSAFDDCPSTLQLIYKSSPAIETFFKDSNITCSKKAVSFSRTIGDVNNDSKINSNDAFLTARYALNPQKYSLDANSRAAADYNGDGKVNSNDAFLIARRGLQNI